MANEIKTRDPQAKLYHKDYLTWINNTVVWLGTQVAEPDYPAHLAPDLAPLIPPFAAALDSWHVLNELAIGRNEIFTNIFDALRDQLQLIKESLPTVADEPPVLAEFGIDAALSRDRDEFYIQAKAANDHWAVVSAEPQFAPLVADFGIFTGLYADFVAAKENYYTTFNASQQAQNDVLTTRAAIHECEREIFGWYRARHKNGTDEWWTATWWGTTSGGEEPPAPEWPDWPGPVEASAEQIDEGLVRLTYSGLNGGKTLRIDRLKQGDADYVPVTDGLPLDDPEEVMPFDDNHLDKKKYTYKLTPFDEVGNPGTPALVEVTVS